VCSVWGVHRRQCVRCITITALCRWWCGRRKFRQRAGRRKGCGRQRCSAAEAGEVQRRGGRQAVHQQKRQCMAS